MSTQSDARAHLESVAAAARSHKEQAERIRELETEVEKAWRLLREGRPAEWHSHEHQWWERKNAWLFRNTPTDSEPSK